MYFQADKQRRSNAGTTIQKLDQPTHLSISMKCALVTGGSRGIGRAICIKLAAMGYYVLVNYKGNETEAANTMALIKEKGGDGELLQFDVAVKEDIQQKLGDWIETNKEKAY